MRLISAQLLTLRMPLVSPFITSFGRMDERYPLLVHVQGVSDGRVVDGWGECVALVDPMYSPEYLDGANDVLTRYLIPQLFLWQDAHDGVGPNDVLAAFPHVVGHQMAKAALEMAVLDAWLRLQDLSFASYLGVARTSVPSGVSIGIQPSIAALLDAVAGYLQEGYTRIKIKIKPGWDIEPVRAIRERFGAIPLQVDANSSYTLRDISLLASLDEFGLLLIEQPLGEDDIRQHSVLAKALSTPICLDESVVSFSKAEDAIILRAAGIINIKPGRVGGYLTAKRIHDLARKNDVPLWCGGMLETGIGRYASAALAGLPGFTLPGDISASERFYAQDITEPVVMRDGYIDIYQGAGLCPEPIPEALAEFTVDCVTID
jgi:O-succinylbenzoate synthase